MAINLGIVSKARLGGVELAGWDGNVDCEGAQPIDVAVPAEAADMEVAFAVAVADMLALSFHSDKAITLKTNDTVAPDDEWEIGENGTLTWTKASGAPCPFKEDVAKLFLSNASLTEDARFRLVAGYDATPTP